MKDEYTISPLVKAMVASDFNLETLKALADNNKIITDIWHIPDEKGQCSPERRAYVIMDDGIWRLLKCKADVILFANIPNGFTARITCKAQRMQTLKKCWKNLFKKT